VFDIKYLLLNPLMIMAADESLSIRQKIEIYKWCWISEIYQGISDDELDYELQMAEEIEDYGQCQGIILAREYFKNLNKDKDE